nr:hypothetical protein [Tanacetum cinerariifolium]
MNSQPKNQFEHVDQFDIDDSDLRPTAALCPCNREHQTRTTGNLVPSTQTPEIDYSDEKTVRIVPGPAGIVQAAKIRKLADFRKGGQDCCFRVMKTFCQNWKLPKVVAVVKSCTPNALGDLLITLKDPSVLRDGTGVKGSGVLDEEEIMKLLEEEEMVEVEWHDGGNFTDQW